MLKCVSIKISPKLLLFKGVLKLCNRFIGEHLCRSVISIKLQNNVIGITLLHGCSPVHTLGILKTPGPKKAYGGLVLKLSLRN